MKRETGKRRNVVGNLNRLFLVLSVFMLASVTRAEEASFSLKDGDNVVLVGDSITEQGCQYPWGYCNVLARAADEAAKEDGLKVNFIPLGFSGYQVKSWSDMERDSVTNADLRTWYDNPGWSLKEVFDGKVDVIVIFLGMNDLILPTMRDTDADRARWLADYRTLVGNLRERCHPRRFAFATITPLTTDPQSPKNIVRHRLRDMLVGLAAAEDASILDFGGVIEKGVAEFRKADPAYHLIPDFVHPNGVGHALMAREVLNRLWEGRGAKVPSATIEAELKACAERGKASRPPAAPWSWRLSEDGGEWRVYTATDDYTGGAKPGSVDPYQCFFGWQTNTLKAARRVWSGKERDVKAVLSHQGFSQTLDLSVAFDGEVVWRDSLDRFGRNRREKTLHLRKGWNALEVTCVHQGWQRQFAFDLEPLPGDELSDLRYDLK